MNTPTRTYRPGLDFPVSREQVLRLAVRSAVRVPGSIVEFGVAEGASTRVLRSELRRLSRARFTMNAWRLIHIPASIVLLAVIAVHVLSVWLY